MVQPVFASHYLETLQARAKEKNLAADPYWHRLLHESRTLLGIYQSEIDDPTFFLSPRGRKDPAAELNATLEGFFASPAASLRPLPEREGKGEAQDQAAQCRYPARFAWLDEQLHFDRTQMPQPDCSRYENWKAQMDADSLSLVFASYFMNNPASTYGHTFLRLNGKNHSSSHLLDYVVNFAADLEADNGALFALKGLAGGYHGRFSTFPYYMKVQQYNNLESRDLWEYDLHVSSASMERLVEHLWELGNTRLPYFFLNKNCSYYLLPVLEVMDPSLSLSRPFVLKAIPMDTVRQVIRSPGLLERVTYRPSHATKMIVARERLSSSEILLAEQVVRDPAAHSQDLAAIPPERRAMLLDSAYDLFRYQVGFKRDQPTKIQEKEQRLLLLRSQVQTSSPTATGGGSMVRQTSGGDSQAMRPDLGHKTGRVDVSYGFSNHSHFEELSLRPALHSQEDPPAGYLPGSQLEMFHLKLRYDDDRKTAYIQEFPLVNLLSVTPWDRWIHPPSWKVNTGLAVANDLNRDPENSLYYGLNLGSGYSAWIPGIDHLLVYGMVEMETQLSRIFHHSIRFGGGPCAGLLFTPATYWRATFQISQDEYAVGGTPSTTKLAFTQSLSVSKNAELRTELQRQNTYKEVLLSWVLFL